jgi:hypothetical protein
MNVNEKINPQLINVIFVTALPQKEEMPWTKNPKDISVVINECKDLFKIIALDI